jgi:catechol-2,3-dioxygenase
MANVTELRVALTVTDFGQALAFYRDTLGLQQLADWRVASGIRCKSAGVVPASW